MTQYNVLWRESAKKLFFSVYPPLNLPRFARKTLMILWSILLMIFASAPIRKT